MKHNIISSKLEYFSVPDVDIDYALPPKPVFKLDSSPKKISQLVHEVEYTIEHSLTLGKSKVIDIKFTIVIQYILKHQEIPPDKEFDAAIEDIFKRYTDTIYPEFEKTHLKAVKFDLTTAKQSSMRTIKEAFKHILN